MRKIQANVFERIVVKVNVKKIIFHYLYFYYITFLKCNLRYTTATAMPHISFEEFEPGNMEKWAICAEKELFSPVASLPKWDLGEGITTVPYLTKDELNTTKTR